MDLQAGSQRFLSHWKWRTSGSSGRIGTQRAAIVVLPPPKCRPTVATARKLRSGRQTEHRRCIPLRRRPKFIQEAVGQNFDVSRKRFCLGSFPQQWSVL